MKREVEDLVERWREKQRRPLVPAVPVIDYIVQLRRTVSVTQNIVNTLNKSEFDPPAGYEKWDLHAYIEATASLYEKYWPGVEWERPREG